MRPEIRPFRPDAEFAIPEGCSIIELSNDAADPQASIARARVARGVTTRWHRLRGTVERYIILNGRGRVEVGNLAPAEVGPGDVVLIPAECRQRVASIGEEDLVFLAVCTPRYVPECYEEIDSPADRG